MLAPEDWIVVSRAQYPKKRTMYQVDHALFFDDHLQMRLLFSRGLICALERHMNPDLEMHALDFHKIVLTR